MVTILLAPRTARAIDLAIGERTDGPVFLATDGRRVDRHGAGRIVRKVARRAGIAKTVTPHTLRHALSQPCWTPESPCATCKKPPLMQIRAPRCGPEAAWTDTPPISSPPTERAGAFCGRCPARRGQCPAADPERAPGADGRAEHYRGPRLGQGAGHRGERPRTDTGWTGQVQVRDRKIGSVAPAARPAVAVLGG